jgi:hypothetical protein
MALLNLAKERLILLGPSDDAAISATTTGSLLTFEPIKTGVNTGPNCIVEVLEGVISDDE